ncbi:uncharacterized protein LOC107883319 isoform X1 [Acyrthosiphon pisum]|uniref:Uncharacterized protein n=1 Tax=Acyrthosiphon pisum TaxID=7029 RepID=A0A8R2D2N7_ACYPI|nr:uncharacterized protein LOC107883319 isoform X1 [Acyrthosiphon pisum]
MVSYKLLTILTVIFDIIIFCNGVAEVSKPDDKEPHSISKRVVPEPETKGLQIVSEGFDTKERDCWDILLKVGFVYKTGTAHGLLNYCFVKDFDSYETFKEYAMEKIGNNVLDDAGHREMGIFYSIYTQISKAEIKVILMTPHFFCYIKRLAEIKNEKENSLWSYISAKLPANIFSQSKDTHLFLANTYIIILYT